MGVVKRICWDCKLKKRMGSTRHRCTECRIARPGLVPPPKVVIQIRERKARRKIRKKAKKLAKAKRKAKRKGIPFVVHKPAIATGGPKSPPKPRPETYAHRNSLLKKLGYETYTDYLASDLWGRVKAAGFAKHGTACRVCDKPATVLHHLSYVTKVLKGEDLDELVPMCQGRHHRIEFTEDGTKRHLHEAVDFYYSIMFKSKRL